MFLRVVLVFLRVVLVFLRVVLVLNNSSVPCYEYQFFLYLGFNKPSDHGQLCDGETQTRASHRVSHYPKDYVALGANHCGVFTPVEHYPFL